MPRLSVQRARFSLMFMLLICLATFQTGCITYTRELPQPLSQTDYDKLATIRNSIARKFELRYSYHHDDHAHEAVPEPEMNLAIQKVVKKTGLVGGGPYGSKIRLSFDSYEYSPTVLNFFSGLTLLIIPGYVSNDLEMTVEYIVDGQVRATVTKNSRYAAIAELLLFLGLPFNNWDVEVEHARRLSEVTMFAFVQELIKQKIIPEEDDRIEDADDKIKSGGEVLDPSIYQGREGYIDENK